MTKTTDRQGSGLSTKAGSNGHGLKGSPVITPGPEVEPRSTGVDPESAATLTLKQWVVAAVGATLVVLFAGLAVILSLGQTVPTQYWASASTLTGALVGILARPSAAKLAAKKRDAPARVTARYAYKEARNDAAPHLLRARLANLRTTPAPTVRQAQGNDPQTELKGKAGSLPSGASEDGTTPADAIFPGGYLPLLDRLLAATDLRVVGLVVIGACSMVGGIWLTLSTTKGPTVPAAGQTAAVSTQSTHDTALIDDGNTLIAIGSAAGGAVIGLLSPVAKKAESNG